MDIRDLRDADLGPALDVAQQWDRVGDELRGYAGRMRTLSGFPDWSGTAADGMSLTVSSSAERTHAAGSAASATAWLIYTQHAALTAAQGAVRSLMWAAEAAGMTVRPDGSVIPGRGVTGVLAQLPVIGSAVGGGAAAVTAVLKATMAVVSQSDGALSDAVRSICAVDPPAVVDETVFSPGAVAALVSDPSEILGKITFPRALRDSVGPQLGESLEDAAVAAYRELALRGVDPDEVGVSVAGTDGSAAVVVGDLDSAERITTIVSGVGSASPGARVDSAALAGRIAAPGHAAVAWHDYSAPSSLLDAAGRRRTRPGGENLRRFQQRLRSRNPDASLAVAAHSLGTVVAADAAADPDAPLDVDTLTLMGSPGLGVERRSIDDLHLRALDGRTEVNVHKAPGEPISAVADAESIHGDDPADAGYGADRVNGRSRDDDGGALGRAWDSWYDVLRAPGTDGEAHSSYRGDEKVLRELRGPTHG